MSTDRPDDAQGATPQDRTFTRAFLTALAGVGGLLALFLLLVDPYGVSPLRLPIDYVPMASNQRYSYPALVRHGDFDSAITGSSMSRMLKPASLNGPLGIKAVNLAMNTATAWEQVQILNLFLEHNPQPRLILFTLDAKWCSATEPSELWSWVDYPKWLFDGASAADLIHYFNIQAVETGVRRVAHAVGLWPPRYGPDGYVTLNFSGTPYDLARARQFIYGQPEPVPPAPPLSEPAVSDAELAAFPYPDLAMLRTVMGALPSTTVKLLVAPPHHQHYLGAPGGTDHRMIEGCKRRAASLLANMDNVVFLDFWYRTDLTMDDSNYWDAGHYREHAASRIEQVLVSYLRERRIDDPIARVILDNRKP